MNNICCVVIPIHITALNIYEYASIIQTIKILNSYDIYIVCPNDLNVDSFLQFIKQKTNYKSQNIFVKKFDNIWFRSYGAYNRLCCQMFFYDSFKQYEYMLIAQNDAWIFKDELQEWCKKAYDYIGAPWCQFCKNVHKCQYEESTSYKSVIGNGGLSLRKISKFIDVTNYLDRIHALQQYSIDNTPAEDNFLMQFPNISWNLPKCKDAIQFSIEGLPLKHINSGIMPFGYHNMLKVFPQAAFLLHFKYNIMCNLQLFK